MVKATDGVSAKGKTLLAKLWDELDSIMDRLMADGAPTAYNEFDEDVEDIDWGQFQSDWLEYGEERGRAQGVAFAIATIESPYKPSVPRVKKRAVERWHERQKK